MEFDRKIVLKQHSKVKVSVWTKTEITLLSKTPLVWTKTENTLLSVQTVRTDNNGKLRCCLYGQKHYPIILRFVLSTRLPSRGDLTRAVPFGARVRHPHTVTKKTWLT